MKPKVAVILDDCAKTVARFNANSDRANLNCNRNPSNTNSSLGISCPLGQYFKGKLNLKKTIGCLKMKTHKNLYLQLCKWDNLYGAYVKAKRGKSKKDAIIEFDKNAKENLEQLQKELINLDYEPKPLKRFIVRDPKTRTIHASKFRDRVVHHALVNILEPIFEKVFIFDSYASRKDKGAHMAVARFDEFKRKVSQNGRAVWGGERTWQKIIIEYKVMCLKQILPTILIMLITKFL